MHYTRCTIPDVFYQMCQYQMHFIRCTLPNAPHQKWWPRHSSPDVLPHMYNTTVVEGYYVFIVLVMPVLPLHTTHIIIVYYTASLRASNPLLLSLYITAKNTGTHKHAHTPTHTHLDRHTRTHTYTSNCFPRKEGGEGSRYRETLFNGNTLLVKPWDLSTTWSHSHYRTNNTTVVGQPFTTLNVTLCDTSYNRKRSCPLSQACTHTHTHACVTYGTALFSLFKTCRMDQWVEQMIICLYIALP